jgi:hypothetical protein
MIVKEGGRGRGGDTSAAAASCAICSNTSSFFKTVTSSPYFRTAAVAASRHNRMPRVEGHGQHAAARARQRRNALGRRSCAKCYTFSLHERRVRVPSALTRHILAVSSSLPVMSTLARGWNDTQHTLLPCPRSAASHVASQKSSLNRHSLTVPSSHAVASAPLDGWNATDSTCAKC